MEAGDKPKRLSIRSWSEEDRPREKLISKGRESLTDAELIAILLGSGSKEYSAVGLGQLLLNEVNSDLDQLGRLSLKNLQQFKGIGEAKAVSIVAALELGRRRKASAVKSQSIGSSNDAFHHLYPLLADFDAERFIVLLLNRANKVIKAVPISQGGVSGTFVDPKLVYKAALDELATSIILAHNHPSGNLKPSPADRELTQKIKKAGLMLDITVLDHLIIGGNGYFSFADEGIL